MDNINQLAEAKKCTPAQLALAWILHQVEDYVPIPGTRSVKRLIENAGATSIVLSPVERDQINQLIPSDLVFGQRYPEAMMSSLDK